MQAVDTEVDSGALTGFDNFILELLLHLGYNFLNTGWMNTSVGYQLVEGQTTYLAAHGVEGRDDDGLRSVVYNNLDTSGSFQGTNVATLTTDDAALHLVVVYMEDTDRILYSRFCGHALDGLDNYLLGLLVGIELGIIHNLVDVAGSIESCLIFQALDEALLSFLSAQAREFLKLLLLLTLHLLQLLLLQGEELLLVLHALVVLLYLLLAAAELFLALVERNLTLLELVLALLNA